MSMCTKANTFTLQSAIKLYKYSGIKSLSCYKFTVFHNYQQFCHYSVGARNNRKLLDNSINSGNFTFSKYINNIRSCSTSVKSESVALPPDYIPPPPEIPPPVTPPDIQNQFTDALTNGGEILEPSFISLGLGSWTPTGLVESFLEAAHIGAGMPWWMTIVLGTCLVRVCMFPLVIKSQRLSAYMNNNLPQMQILQKNMLDARKSGDRAEAMKAAQELNAFMTEKNINPLKQMFLPVMQAPVFISIFLALRKMANLPVESMKDGGLFWFSNLTIPDPFYLTPIICSLTLLITVEVGTDGLRANNMGQMRYVMRAMPFVCLPFMIQFPSAIIMYWMTTNVISLGQVLLLRTHGMKARFNIPDLATHPQDSLPMNKGFFKGFKDTWKNSTIIKEMEDRKRVDAVKFKKAGIDPIQKTYPYDPTKQKT